MGLARRGEGLELTPRPLWRNWAGDQRCAPAAIERPASEQEVAEALRRAVRDGLRARVAGAGHSFTDIACTDGVMLSLDRMSRVLEADPRSGSIRTQAGIRLHDLSAELAGRGLALENLGDVDTQTLAGALSTGTHGTGASFGNLSTQVSGLRMVSPDGEIVDCSSEKEPDLFRAARVGLGALGVITEVTLRCMPLYALHRIDEPRPLDRTLARLDDHAGSHDHFELFVFPYTETALTRTTERTDREPVPVAARRRWVDEVLVQNGLLGAVCRAGRALPTLIPTLNRAVTGAMGRAERLDHSHRVYATRRLVRFTEMEYAIPRAAAAEAVRRVLALVERRRLPVAFPVEVRFAAGDDAFLSPSHERESCYVAVHMYRGVEFESYFRAVESIMTDYGGRPHWGKRHYRTAETLGPLYRCWARFAAVRERLDPGGVLANDYTDRVLGLPGAR